MSELASLSPHPTLASRSLLYWLGGRSRRRLLAAVDREVVGTVGLRLVDASRGPTVSKARERGLGVALGGEAWRNQLEPDHPLRGDRWRSFGYDVGGRRRQPDRRAATPEERQDLIVPYLQAQVRAAGTLLTSPGHYSDDPVGTSRRNDLAMAADCADRAHRLGLRRPRGDQIPRVLYATLLVDARKLTPQVVRWLVGAYTELLATPNGPDGVWLDIANFTPSGLRFALVGDLVLALQENTAKPTVTAGLGPLWAAGLTNGMAAVCTGPEHSTLNLPPPMPDVPDEDEDDEIKRRTCVFHSQVMHTFGLSHSGPRRERDSFRRYGCICGHHEQFAAPSNERERVLHNTSETMKTARDAAAGAAEDASSRLGERLPHVDQRRTAIGLKRLGPAWRLAGAAVGRPGQARGRAA